MGAAPKCGIQLAYEPIRHARICLATIGSWMLRQKRKELG